MWLKLTLHDDSPLRINSDLVEAYQETDENGCQCVLSTNNSSYSVKESVKLIDILMEAIEIPVKLASREGWK